MDFLEWKKQQVLSCFVSSENMARNGHHEGRHGVPGPLQDVLYIFQLQRVIAERQALESLNRKLVPWKQISSCWPDILWANFLFVQMVVILSKGIPTNMALYSDFKIFKTIQPWSLTTCSWKGWLEDKPLLVTFEGWNC